LFWDIIALAVHRMFVEIVDLHRAKCAEPDVKRDGGEAMTGQLELFEEGVRKMKTGRRRRDGAAMFGEDRLIALTIELARFALHIGRKRHHAERIDRRVDRAWVRPSARRFEAQCGLKETVFVSRPELHRETIAKSEALSLGQLF